MSGPLVVVGDALLDRDVDGKALRLCPDAPAPVLDSTVVTTRPGGAALAAALAAGDGAEVVLVTALGPGGAGGEIRSLLEAAGVDLVDLGLGGPNPEKTRFRASGQVLLRHDVGGGPAPTGPAGAAARSIAAASAVLVADYGRGVAAHPELRAMLASRRSVVWDPHPRGAEPVPGVALATPNRSELAGSVAAAVEGAGLAEVTASAAEVRRRWRAVAVAVTLGRGGALLVGDGAPLAVPARALEGPVDTCGAGDRFASAAAAALGAGALASEAVVAAVASATDFVAAGGASAWRSPRRCGPVLSAPGGRGGRGLHAVAERLAAVRRQGGTVVATGGCFDLLHAGHIHLLHSARALGDALVVCVNSDASVRRLKGAERPVVTEGDRVAMLEALGCVDEVVCFDDDTPVEVLRVLRPDVFVKGGDYTGRSIPETEVLARWGGQTVTVPYLGGRSTTGLLSRVRSES